jgi:hypothetical protein
MEDINIKIQNIILLLKKVDFKEILSSEETFEEKVSYYPLNDNNDYFLYEKKLSDSEHIYFRIRKRKNTFNDNFLHLINVYHIKDSVFCFYLSDKDVFLEDDCEFNTMLKKINDKFRFELRKNKIKSLLK